MTANSQIWSSSPSTAISTFHSSKRCRSAIFTTAAGAHFGRGPQIAFLQTRFRLLPSAETSGDPRAIGAFPEARPGLGSSAHSHNFCDTCKRVGHRKSRAVTCLGQTTRSIYDADHAGPAAGDADLRNAIVDCMGNQTLGHEFTEQMENPKVVRFMSMTGG